MTIQNLIEKYKTGHRYFVNLNIDKGEKLTGLLLTDTIFENCYFSADFTNTNFLNSKFIGCSLNNSDFTKCNLANTVFENCALESIIFKDAILADASFIDCFCLGTKVYLDKINNEITTYKTPLVQELYDNIPEFIVICDHLNDELTYTVYGDLSLKLFDDITNNKQTTPFTLKCFKFFNLLGNREDENIDNLLVVGIYEGLYSNKKCNNISLQLLKGRNKEIYEHWMRNGNIRADYKKSST